MCGVEIEFVDDAGVFNLVIGSEVVLTAKGDDSFETVAKRLISTAIPRVVNLVQYRVAIVLYFRNHVTVIIRPFHDIAIGKCVGRDTVGGIVGASESVGPGIDGVVPRLGTGWIISPKMNLRSTTLDKVWTK